MQDTHRHRNGPSLLPGTLTSLLALLVSVAILLMGNGLLTTLVPVRGSLERFLDYEIGLLGSAYFVGFTLGCLFGPAVISRAGHIRAYLAMISGASVVALLHALVVEPSIWWVLRGATGFCFAVLTIVVESWLNEQSTNDNRGTVFSIYVVINLTVISAGQMMLALADPKAFTLFAISSMLVSLAAMPVAFTNAVSPRPIPKIWPRLATLYRISPVGLAGCFAVGLANGSFWALGPVFALDRGLDSLGIGLFMSASVLGGAAVQWPLGWISDRFDRRRVIVLAALTALAAAMSLMMFGPANQQTMLVLAAVFGIGAFPIYALSVAHANDHAATSDYVEISSGLLLVFGIGASIGPAIAGGLRQSIPGPTLFYFTAMVHLSLIAFVLLRMRQRKAPIDEDRVGFSDALVASKTLSPIEPNIAISAKRSGVKQ